MALTSTLITAKKPNAVNNDVEFGATGALDEDNLVMNDAAQICVNTVKAIYAKVAKNFDSLASELNKTKANVTGQKLKRKIGNISKQCSNQAQYCRKRSKEMVTSFDRDKQKKEFDAIVAWAESMGYKQ